MSGTKTLAYFVSIISDGENKFFTTLTTGEQKAGGQIRAAHQSSLHQPARQRHRYNPRHLCRRADVLGGSCQPHTCPAERMREAADPLAQEAGQLKEDADGL